MATLPGQYGGKPWYSSPTDGSYSYRYLAVGDEALTLRRSQMRGFLRGMVHIGSADYVVHWRSRGTVVLDTRADPQPLPLQQPRLSPDGKTFEFEAADYDARLVHLNRELVREVASEQAGLTLHVLQFDVATAPGAAAMQQWRDALAAVSAVVADRMIAPLAWHEATRSAARAFLALYPPTGEMPQPALLHARNARVRAAVEFIRARAEEPLTVTQIADAAGLSIRSTQESFQRVLGVTPMQYLQQLRLERVRAELVIREPQTTTVSAVARQWGFFHAGRFSGQYRERFGELPTATLRR